MRDELFGRIWVAHHEDFSINLSRGLAVLRGAVARLPAWDGTTAHLLALVAAFVVTGLTFNTTA